MVFKGISAVWFPEVPGFSAKPMSKGGFSCLLVFGHATGGNDRTSENVIMTSLWRPVKGNNPFSRRQVYNQSEINFLSAMAIKFNVL